MSTYKAKITNIEKVRHQPTGEDFLDVTVDVIDEESEEVVSTRLKNQVEAIFDFANTHHTQTTEAAQGTLWGAYNSISGYYNYIAPFRTQEDKFNSQMFGNANNKINKEFEKARILTLS